MSNYDPRYTKPPPQLESFTCSVCGKRRHTGHYSVRHDACSRIKQAAFEAKRVEEMAEKLSRAIDRMKATGGAPT